MDESLGLGIPLNELDPEFAPLVPLLRSSLEPFHHLMILTPNFFENARLPGRNNVGYTMWETDRLPEHWPKLCNRMDALCVPSRFCRDVFQASGVTVPIHVVPIPVDTYKFDSTPAEPLFPVADDVLTFYSIFQWNERKNPVALLAAFVQAFDASDRVQLIVKTHVRGLPSENEPILREAGAIVNAFLQGRPMPKIEIVTGRLTHSQILQLHREGDVYVGPVRGEGFSLPMFDAALAGNHVVATNFSSHLEFLEAFDSSGRPLYDLVDFQLVPVNYPGNAFYESTQNWAQIDIGDLVERLRSCYRRWRDGGNLLPGAEDRRRHARHLQMTWSRAAALRSAINALEKTA